MLKMWRAQTPVAHDASAVAHGSRQVFGDSVTPYRLGPVHCEVWGRGMYHEVRHSAYAELRGGVREAVFFLRSEDLAGWHLLHIAIHIQPIHVHVPVRHTSNFHDGDEQVLATPGQGWAPELSRIYGSLAHT